MLEVIRDVMCLSHLKVLEMGCGVAAGQKPPWRWYHSTPRALDLCWRGSTKLDKCLQLRLLLAAAECGAVHPALVSSSIMTNTVTLITTLSSVS